MIYHLMAHLQWVPNPRGLYQTEWDYRLLNAETDPYWLVCGPRRRRGLTLEKLVAKLGMRFPTINHWENDRINRLPLPLNQISDFLLNFYDPTDDSLGKPFGLHGS